jgi:hypothetical protein
MIEFSRKAIRSHIPNPGTEYDVIVAGGGPAAIGAAVGAARAGAMTAIFESRSQFGGTWTAGMWMNINWFFLDNEGTSRGGAHQMIFDRLQQWEGDSYLPGINRGNVAGGNLLVHPEYLKLALFQIFEDLGIHYGLYSPVTGVLKEADTVTGVKITGREGVVPFRSRTVVDATGDGDALWHAGCEMTEGREYDGRHMPMTLLFCLAGVDEDKLFAYLGEADWKDILASEKEKGEFNVTSGYGFFRTNIPGMVTVNNGGSADMEFDGARTRDLTAMERLGNQLALDFVRFARERKIPGLEDCHLSRTGAYVAPRDARRLVGEYVLTEDDVRLGTEFEDTVARKYGGFDAVGFYGGPAFVQGAAYPYRSMLPKRIDNLLAAGRCGSATFLAHGAGKSMGNMIEVGQAAGVAAAIAAIDGVKARDVDVKKVQTFIAEELGVKRGKGNSAS